MRRRHQYANPYPHQRPPDGCPMDHRRAADPEVVLLTDDPLLHVAPVLEVERHLHVGITPAEFGHRRAHQTHRHPRHGHQTQALHAAIADFAGNARNLVEIGQDTPRLLQKCRPLGREHHTPPFAQEQGELELAFEQGDQPADRWLAQAQGFGRRIDRPFADHEAKRSQGLDVHSIIRFCYRLIEFMHIAD